MFYKVHLLFEHEYLPDNTKTGTQIIESDKSKRANDILNNSSGTKGVIV